MRRHRFRVELGPRSYPIYLGHGLVSSVGSVCRSHQIDGPIIVLSDTNSGKYALPKVIASLRASGYDPIPVGMPAGERQKSVDRAVKIHTELLRRKIPRTSALMTLGGGVVGDVGGFVAATYRRGITLLQCPTTLLSQVDSSVGGKNGVNLRSGKNAIGSFLQPRFVLADTALLRTLPRREINSGLGEIVKYPFVGDPPLLSFIERNLDGITRLHAGPLLRIAARCLKIKTRFVSLDETERKRNGRDSLNIGHAIGHAIETLSAYRLRHGEAVFLGLIGEAAVSVQRGWLAERHLNRLIELYHRLACRFSLGRIPDRSIVGFLTAKGPSRFVLPAEFGSVRVTDDVTPREISHGLSVIRGM